MVAAGVDTWSICWYLGEDSSAHRAAEAMATIATARGRMFDDQVDDHKVIFFPGSRMLAVEGHPGGEERLAGIADLPAASERLVEGLQDLGLQLPGGLATHGRAGFGGVRRVDLTCDLERTAVVGSAILNCVAAVEPPGQIRSDLYRSKSGRAIETVAWRGGRRTISRVYDKGVERGNGRHRRGELLRFEDQRRFDRSTRPTVDMLVEGYARVLFHTRFRALRAATEGVTVTTIDGVIEKLEQLVDEGTLTPSDAKKLLATVVLDSRGVELGSRTTRWRQRRDLRQGGLILADGVLQEGESLDLSGELDEMFEVAFRSDAA
jgi:hypothetical protein